jgi:hypothetical protein
MASADPSTSIAGTRHQARDVQYRTLGLEWPKGDFRC